MNTNNTVLVISDGHEQFASTASMLRGDGFNVRFLRCANDGLDLAGAEAPRLIISELAVPDVDGLQICRRVRADLALEKTPVLLIGDLSRQSSIVEDGIRCGAVEYVQKPIDPFKLAHLCRGILEPQADTPDEDLFSSLIADISDAITIIDADNGTVFFQSASAERIFGASSNDLIGNSVFDRIHPADRAEVKEYFDSIHWGFAASAPVEYRFRQLDGSWRLVESIARSVDDPRFGPAVIVTSRACQTREYSFETAFKNDVVRRATFDTARVGLAMFSLSGHFVKGNDALFEMLDYRRDELENMSLGEFVYPDDNENDKRLLAEVLSGKRDHYRFENVYLSPAGERLSGMLTVVAITDDNDDSRFFIAIFETPVASCAGETSLDRFYSPAKQGGGSKIVDFKSWKVNKGLICTN